MSLPKISTKRKASTRLRHNSTFGAKAPVRSVMTIAELKASGLLSKASELGKGKSDKAKAKARAWKWFSMFIRLRDAGPDGQGKCITCSHRAHWRQMDAGHYITRAKESTLFDERNVSLQCKGCNRFQGGKFFEHAQAIDRKFGEGTKAAIEAKAAQLCRRDLKDYQFIEATFKQRVDWIKHHEPTKFKP